MLFAVEKTVEEHLNASFKYLRSLIIFLIKKRRSFCTTRTALTRENDVIVYLIKNVDWSA